MLNNANGAYMFKSNTSASLFFIVILSFGKNGRIICMRARLFCVQYCLCNHFELCNFLFVYYGTGYFEFAKALIVWFRPILFILEQHPCQFPFQFWCVYLNLDANHPGDSIMAFLPT